MMRMDGMKTSGLLDLLTQAAQDYEHALENTTAKEANRNVSVGDRVVRELERRGAERELLALIEHPIPIVRGWAAAYALKFAPDVAMPVLDEMISTLRGIPAFHARTALLVWQETN